MTPHPTAETRLNNITAYLIPVVTLLDELSEAFGSSFISQISKITLKLITGIRVTNFTFHVPVDGSPGMQNVKRNRDECIQIMENIHQVLYAIVNLHIKSETAGSLHPAVLDHIGKFMEYIIWV
jgi:hypothetical protein